MTTVLPPGTAGGDHHNQGGKKKAFGWTWLDSNTQKDTEKEKIEPYLAVLGWNRTSKKKVRLVPLVEARTSRAGPYPSSIRLAAPEKEAPNNPPTPS